jgi:hypothetical protein
VEWSLSRQSICRIRARQFGATRSPEVAALLV